MTTQIFDLTIRNITELQDRIKTQAARIAKLKAALRELDDMIVDLDAGHIELHQVSRFIAAVLAGGKDGCN